MARFETSLPAEWSRSIAGADLAASRPGAHPSLDGRRGKAGASKGASREAAIEAVRDYFYRGEIARKIDEFVEQNGGLLRYEDLAAFHLQVEEPVSATYNGYTFTRAATGRKVGVMLEALNILEGYDLELLGWNSAEYIHRMVEALKLAYADRDTLLRRSEVR